MKIVLGKYSGFCNGVKYTVDKAREVLNNNDTIYSLGDIVHNEVVINELKDLGLKVKDKIDEIPCYSKVIIRAHGETIDTYEKAKDKKINIIDLTCGKVKIIHEKILNKKDSFVIIVGKKNHPETIAHQSYSKNSYVIESAMDINEALNSFISSKKKSVYVVAQTTFNSRLFDEIVSQINEVFNTPVIVDKTICNVTSLRQEETRELAKKVNKMIIIGGKNSSNTKELEMVAKENCQYVYLIQTVNDLHNDMFNEKDIVGITAGASTPKELIKDIVFYLESLYINKE